MAEASITQAAVSATINGIRLTASHAETMRFVVIRAESQCGVNAFGQVKRVRLELSAANLASRQNNAVNPR